MQSSTKLYLTRKLLKLKSNTVLIMKNSFYHVEWNKCSLDALTIRDY